MSMHPTDLKPKSPRPRPQVMKITDRAAERIRNILAQKGDATGGLRIGACRRELGIDFGQLGEPRQALALQQIELGLAAGEGLDLELFAREVMPAFTE